MRSLRPRYEAISDKSSSGTSEIVFGAWGGADVPAGMLRDTTEYVAAEDPVWEGCDDAIFSVMTVLIQQSSSRATDTGEWKGVKSAKSDREIVAQQVPSSGNGVPTPIPVPLPQQ